MTAHSFLAAAFEARDEANPWMQSCLMMSGNILNFEGLKKPALIEMTGL